VYNTLENEGAGCSRERETPTYVPKKVTSPSTVNRRQLYQEETASGDDDNIVCSRSGSPEAGCSRERDRLLVNPYVNG